MTQKPIPQNIIIYILAGVMFLASAFYFIYHVPMNDDEVTNYHVVACQTHQVARAFDAYCGDKLTLNTPLGFSYQRSYLYAGGLSSLLFAPIHHVFPSPHTPFFYGLFVYMIFCGLLARLSSRPLLSFALFLPFFPMLFQIMHDTGPLKFPMLVFALTPILYRWAMGQRTHIQIFVGVVLGLLFTMAFEDKVYFLYLLLPISIFTVAIIIRPRQKILAVVQEKKSRPLLVTLIIGAGVGFAFILFSTTQTAWSKNIIPYWMLVLLKSDSFYMPDLIKYITAYITSWISFTHRIYMVTSFSAPWPNFTHELSGVGWQNGLLLAPPTLLFYAYTVFAYRKIAPLASCPPLRVRLLLCASLSFLILALSRTMWAGHHFIFAYIPLMIIFAEIVAHSDRARRIKLVLGYIGVNLLCLITLTTLTPQPDTAWERQKIFAYFKNPKIAPHSIVNDISWGIYHTQSLYSPADSLIVAIRDPRELKKLGQKTKRTIYNICSREKEEKCTIQEMNAMSHGLRFHEVDLGLTQWRVLRAE